MPVLAQPKLYHIVHVDRLASIIADGWLWSDSEIRVKNPGGTVIGMDSIKKRRLTNLLTSRPGLSVGQCVPFYFCPRSVMLYLIHQANHPELAYQGGQTPIVHLQVDLHAAVAWANRQGLRWAFTLSNAGSYYFEDRCDLARLGEVDWAAVHADNWRNCKEGKQAEFLMERCVPWQLVELIGVHSQLTYQRVANALPIQGHRPQLSINRHWYY